MASRRTQLAAQRAISASIADSGASKGSISRLIRVAVSCTQGMSLSLQLGEADQGCTKAFVWLCCTMFEGNTSRSVVLAVVHNECQACLWTCNECFAVFKPPVGAQTCLLKGVSYIASPRIQMCYVCCREIIRVDKFAFAEQSTLQASTAGDLLGSLSLILGTPEG